MKRKCEKCGNNILQRQNKKYCSDKCARSDRLEKTHQKWEESGKFPSQRAARSYLLHHNGSCCSICGTKKWMDQDVPVVMDHINGNSDDHSINNCRLVCRNCDGLLDTFCYRNKGATGTRNKKRLENYHKGKTY